MIKQSKYQVVFIGLSVLLGTGVFITSQKFLPIFLRHTVYYCQSLLHSFSVRIPNRLGTFLAGLLFLAVSFALVKLVIAYIKVVHFRKKLHSQIQDQTTFNQVISQMGLSRKAFLVSSEKPFAFCYGVRHPKIYISTAFFALVSQSELEAILRHEKYHVEHKDSFILLLGEVAQSLFPFFPLLSDLIHNYRIERELAADHEAVLGIGNSKSLISVLKKLLAFEPIEQYVYASAFADHETLEVRIKALTKKGIHYRRFSVVNIGLSIVSIGMFMALVGVPVHAIEVHSQETDVMMICLRNDACTTRCKENSTIVPYTQTPNISYPYSPVSHLSP